MKMIGDTILSKECIQSPPVPHAERSPSGFPVQSDFPASMRPSYILRGCAMPVSVEREIYNQLHLLFGFLSSHSIQLSSILLHSTFIYPTCKSIFLFYFQIARLHLLACNIPHFSCLNSLPHPVLSNAAFWTLTSSTIHIYRRNQALTFFFFLATSSNTL